MAVRLFLRLWGGKAECVWPITALSKARIDKLLGATNLVPLVLTGCSLATFTLAKHAAEMTEVFPRPLILFGERHLPIQGFVDWTPNPAHLEDAASLPWEALGANLLRNG